MAQDTDDRPERITLTLSRNSLTRLMQALTFTVQAIEKAAPPGYKDEVATEMIQLRNKLAWYRRRLDE